MDRLKQWMVDVGAKGAMRIAVLLVFIAAGAIIIGSVAADVLSALFNWFSVSVLHLPPDNEHGPDLYRSARYFIPFVLLGAIVGSFAGVRVIRIIDRLVSRWDKMEAGDKVTFFLGIFAGLVASVPFLLLFQALDFPGPNGPLYRVLLICGVTLGFASLTVYVLQSMAEILPWNRGKSRNKRSGIKVLDTNVIIDGRIYDVAKTGFLEGQLYVPNFVLQELQYLADKHDPLYRQRGRRGLEILKHMQAEFPLEIGTQDKYAMDPKEDVDSRLVRLARALGADIVTNDFNLNRVATLQEVGVLNLNDLALAMKTNILPQETLELKIIREGNQQGQGVGYLDDGTMVVVENGQGHIGEIQHVTVTQVIQTERGKMIFAEVDVDGLDVRKRTTPRRIHE